MRDETCDVFCARWTGYACWLCHASIKEGSAGFLQLSANTASKRTVYASAVDENEVGCAQAVLASVRVRQSREYWDFLQLAAGNNAKQTAGSRTTGQ